MGHRCFRATSSDSRSKPFLDAAEVITCPSSLTVAHPAIKINDQSRASSDHIQEASLMRRNSS
jgi:hypothetical protein